MYSAVVIAALLASAVAIPLHSFKVPSGRIVGGDDATIETYPYQVTLLRYGRFMCGGSIISPDYVLTAAHCVDEESPSSLSIRAGSNFTSDGGTVHHVQTYVIYNNPGNDDSTTDVAVVRMKESFEFNDQCQPIELATASSRAGVDAVVTGWGALSSGGSLPRQLQVVTVPMVSRIRCKKAYGRLHKGEICAGDLENGGKDSCQGDSGGPLTIDGLLAGVVSWGRGCGLPGYPGVYAEVAYFRDWIKKQAKL